MRTQKHIKTILCFIAVTSVFTVVINVHELSKSTEIPVAFNPGHNVICKYTNGSWNNLQDIPKATVEKINTNNNTKNTSAEQIQNVSEDLHNSVDIIEDQRKAEDDFSNMLKSVNEVNDKGSLYTMTIAEFRLKAKQRNEFLMKILNQPYLHRKSKEIFKRYFTGSNYSFESDFKTFKESVKKDFDINNDVMVFLHIQKTGGTYLNDRLFKQLQIPFKCNCPKKAITCKCLNPKGNVWIYSSKFTGWPCGLHADWTQLHRCIPGQIDALEGKNRQRRYFYFTQLRDPINRYLSEYFHQSVRGAHWQDALLGCGAGYSDWTDVRPCFHTETWKGVTLNDFMACQHNLANNRMTRMLADLNKTDCYRKYLDRKAILVRSVKWVESAKENLQQMEYFGFMEDRPASDKLFSSVFKMHFRGRQVNFLEQISKLRMTEQQFLRMLKFIELDVHIYLYAKDLFERRLRNVL